jgi:hypothetical protein
MHLVRRSVFAVVGMSLAAAPVVVPSAFFPTDRAPIARAPIVELSPAAVRELRTEAAARTRVFDRADGAAAGQAIEVNVEPGPLTIISSPTTFTLERVPGTNRLHGIVKGLRVVDARGTGAGWKLGTTITHVRIGARGEPEVAPPVVVRVTNVTAMARTTAGLRVAAPQGIRTGDRASLLTADPRAGLGAFDVSLALDAEAPDAVGSVSGHLQFDLA